MDEETLVDAVGKSVEAIENANINFVAIDFDSTLIDIHTDGNWKTSTGELVSHFRSLFILLIRSLLERDIHVAIVSFSPQTYVIKELLSLVLPDCADRIVIQAKDKAFEPHAGSHHRDGKMKYMAAAVTEIIKCPPTGETNKEITRASSLLIDDDRCNVEIALNNSVRALLFDPMDPESLLADIQDTM